MNSRKDYRFSVTIRTDNRVVANLFRALYKQCEKTGDMKSAGQSEWEMNNHKITFRFKSPDERAKFLMESGRRFPDDMWAKTAESDTDIPMALIDLN
jgi:hypothetical protein